MVTKFKLNPVVVMTAVVVFNGVIFSEVTTNAQVIPTAEDYAAIQAINEKPDLPRRDYEPFIQDILSGEQQLRGAMVLINDSDGKDAFDRAVADLRRLKSYGANHIRLYYAPFVGLTREETEQYMNNLEPRAVYDAYPEWYKVAGEIFRRRWLPLFRELDLPIIMMMDAVPPDLKGENGRVWNDPDERARFVEYLAGIARFWKDDEMIIGFDLINEPIPPGSKSEAYVVNGYKLWWTWSAELARAEVPDGDQVLPDIYNRVIRQIRTFSPDKLLVLEPGPFGSGQGFPALLNVVDDPRIIFSVHVYSPHAFTHYGKKAIVRNDPSLLAAEAGAQFYPNPAMHWDRGIILSVMEGAIDFQKARQQQTGRYCPIYIGEFGTQCLMDENSQTQWFSDALSIIEEQNFGWAAFLYGAGITFNHPHWTQDGSVGAALDIPEFLRAKRDKDLDYFIKRHDQGLRPGWKIVTDCMKRNKKRDTQSWSFYINSKSPHQH